MLAEARGYQGVVTQLRPARHPNRPTSADPERSDRLPEAAAESGYAFDEVQRMITKSAER